MFSREFWSKMDFAYFGLGGHRAHVFRLARFVLRLRALLGFDPLVSARFDNARKCLAAWGRQHGGVGLLLLDAKQPGFDPHGGKPDRLPCLMGEFPNKPI